MAKTSRPIFQPLILEPDLSARGGFTFIEVLVTLTLLAIASSVLVSAHTALLKADNNSGTRLRAGFEIQTIQAELLNGTLATNRPVAERVWGIDVEPQPSGDDSRDLWAISVTPPGKDQAISSVILGSRQLKEEP